MSWRTIGTIYAKEFKDTVRDRRALVSIIVIPTFIMPALMFGFGKAASVIISKAKEEVPRIMVINGADSPGIRAELERSGRFRLEPASADWRTLISEKKVRAAVEIPSGFEKALESGSAPDIALYDFDGELKSG